jgi:hypothetical protein
MQSMTKQHLGDQLYLLGPGPRRMIQRDVLRYRLQLGVGKAVEIG